MNCNEIKFRYFANTTIYASFDFSLAYFRDHSIDYIKNIVDPISKIWLFFFYSTVYIDYFAFIFHLSISHSLYDLKFNYYYHSKMCSTNV